MAFKALFIAIVVVPLLLLTMEATRLLYIHGEIAEAADAAALAAAQEIDYELFRETGAVVLTQRAYDYAYAYATECMKRIWGIQVVPEELRVQGREVEVVFAAHIRPLLPGLGHGSYIARARGRSYVRMTAGP
ncbi:MAG: pilus assembly protein TadG-related protein [Candidatus Hadarchaeales archaeon]